MGLVLALSLSPDRLGASWRAKDGIIKSCSLPLHDGTLALLQLEQLVPQLVRLAEADTVAVEREPAPALRTLIAKIGMECERSGAQVLAKVTRSQAGRTVIGYGGTDRAEIRSEASDCGKLGEVAAMDDAEIAAAIMLVAAEAYVATSAMIDSVKAEAAARSSEQFAAIRASLETRTIQQSERLFPRGQAGYAGLDRKSRGLGRVMSSHIVDRDFERFGR